MTFSIALAQILPLILVDRDRIWCNHRYQRLSRQTAVVNMEIYVQHGLNPEILPLPPSRTPSTVPIFSPIFLFHPFRPLLNPSSIFMILLHRTIMPSSSENRFLKLEGESLPITFVSLS